MFAKLITAQLIIADYQWAGVCGTGTTVTGPVSTGSDTRVLIRTFIFGA